VVYSDQEILAAVEQKHIVIYPLQRDHVRGSSVDVTLGRQYYAVDQLNRQGVYNPFDQEDVQRYFRLQTAVPHAEWAEEHQRPLFKGIPAEHEIIVLGPRQRILAHTQEFIGIYPPGTSEMRARSTWGRNGIVVCKDAGWGDPGYVGRWTKEIQNDNDEAVPLPVGERIAQIVFHHTGPVEHSYGVDGKYQAGDDIEPLIRQWRPETMLPRAWKDRRQSPAVAEPAQRSR